MLCSHHFLLSPSAPEANGVVRAGSCHHTAVPAGLACHPRPIRCRSSSCSTTSCSSTSSLSSMAAAAAAGGVLRAPAGASSSVASEQDVRFATLLSELVYRAAECIDEASFRNAQATVEQELGARLAHVRRHKSGGQRFLVGETDAAIYVAFQGTKSAGDWLANLNFFHGHFGAKQGDGGQQPLQSPDVRASSSSLHSSISSASLASSAAASVSSSDSDLGSSPSSSSSSSRSRAARAHIGFLRRANSAAVSISALHAAAAAAGKRLVLTGHSLGGAVAVLTTVRLLRAITSAGGADASSSSSSDGLTPPSLLNGDDEPLIRCISFATPAVANSELLAEVTAAGWDHFITNIVMPEDPVVPFVNLLLKAPPSPSKPNARPRRLFRAGDAPGSPVSSSACSSSSSSSYGAASICSSPSSPVLTRCSSDGGSQLLALDAGGASSSWDLRLDALDLSGVLNTSLAAGESAAAALLQRPQDAAAAAAAADPWAGQPLPDLGYAHALSSSSQELLELALGADIGAAGAGCGPGSPRMGVVAAAAVVSASGGNGSSSSNSSDLASWLAAAEGAARAANDGPEAASPVSARSFGERRRNSASSNSLYSLQLDLSCLDEPTCSSEAGSSGRSSPITPSPRSRSEPGFLSAAAAARSAAAGGSREQPEGAQQQLERLPLVKRLQQQLSSGRATRWAWISGAVAASLRCASAFAAVPGLAATPHLSLLTLLPRALVGPAALAVLHFVGHAAYKAAMPASHPLGQQFVMTGSGLELVAKPLTAYPRDAEALGLKELGGFCPGHRMIAYRRRLAALVSQQQSP